MLKYLLGVVLFMSTTVIQADWDLYGQVGKGFRSGAYDVAVGWTPLVLDNGKLGIEAAFTDAGEQPDGYENINRMAQINAVAFVKFSERVWGYGKVGANNTKWSHNGTNDYDRDGDDLWGWNASVGLETPIYDHVTLYGQVTVFEYRQVNNPNMGGFTYPSIGLRVYF